jgi:hypothetical protein
MPEKKPTLHYHVRSKLTHARVVIDVPRDVAESECRRLNREAETGVRAAYGEGADHVPEQRLSIGPIQHRGQQMEYEVEAEKRA